MIQATDDNQKTSTIAFTINVSDAPGMLDDFDNLEDIDYLSATVSATIKSVGSRMGFEVKKVSNTRSYEDWTFVEGVMNGNSLSVKFDGLEEGADYLCRLVVDDYISAQVLSFHIPVYPQLPNAGFEEWSKPAKPWLVYTGDESNRFWDTGNHGSTTLSADASITTPDDTKKHSGNYSAKLASKFVGFLSIGKLAAGNIFSGVYLDTDGTDGILGWGHSWNVIPKQLKGWVEYSPVAINYPKKDADVPEIAIQNGVNKGDMDRGIIYIAILKEGVKESFNGKDYPFVVRTKADNRHLFDKNSSDVLAYGEVIFTQATNGMVEFTIDVNRVSSGAPGSLIVVASASQYGDYFMGGDGSTMWLDDLELVY